MSGPRNAIMGDEGMFDLPTTQLEEQDLTAERNAAKFSRTKEFKVLKGHIEDRIAFYQANMPNGEPVNSHQANYADLGAKWAVANVIIGEFKALIQAYEVAQETVDGQRNSEN